LQEPCLLPVPLNEDVIPLSISICGSSLKDHFCTNFSAVRFCIEMLTQKEYLWLQNTIAKLKHEEMKHEYGVRIYEVIILYR
jgi:hypothetical protein